MNRFVFIVLLCLVGSPLTLRAQDGVDPTGVDGAGVSVSSEETAESSDSNAASDSSAATPVVDLEDVDFGFRLSVRLSSLVVKGHGVPNAFRFGLAVGAMVFRAGLFDLAVDAVAMFGNSEKAGFSMRGGVDIEGDIRLASVPISFYLSTGAHFFNNQNPEERVGLLWRAAVGVRLLTSSSVYVGIEPFAIERLPDGEGIHTPIRSRWAFEITFLTVGIRP